MLVLANFFNFGIGNFKGELAAMSAACLWAVASVVWSRVGQRIPPLQLNLFKGSIALVFLALTLFLQGELFPAIAPTAIALLLLSGIIGIGIADTALFSALNFLGPRRTLLVKILTSPSVAFLALIFLQERLTAIAWCGILLTLLGVAWVISERVPGTTGSEKHFWQGIGWAMLSTLGDAIGAILSRAALTLTDISPLWSTTLRLLSGVLVLLLWLTLKGSTEETGSWWRKSLVSPKLFGIITLTAFAGTYLGIWLQQISLKFAPAGIVQTLTATSPLFVLPIAIWMGEKVSLRSILGVGVALAGVALLFWLR